MGFTHKSLEAPDMRGGEKKGNEPVAEVTTRNMVTGSDSKPKERGVRPQLAKKIAEGRRNYPDGYGLYALDVLP